ncbi:hypothetical protein ACP70R_014691 [Stipagrostis hirtigluma subsp. patula]
MGKGRKYGYGGGSDRLLHPPPHVGHAAGAAADHLADLDEEDVWAVGGPAAGSNHRRSTQGGLSLAFDSPSAVAPPARRQQPQQHEHAAASSAPLSVPGWSSNASSHAAAGSSESEEWVAPHEYLQARRGGRGSSVLEGAGRTLKGRDVTRVRDAVWSKTGFFG